MSYPYDDYEIEVFESEGGVSIGGQKEIKEHKENELSKKDDEQCNSSENDGYKKE